jgi:hypothetical protein
MDSIRYDCKYRDNEEQFLFVLTVNVLFKVKL